MSDPERLLFDEEATSAEKQVLESWSEEKPPPGAREKTLASLGIEAAQNVRAPVT